MTLRPLFYSDQDCRDRLKPGKPMFFNVYVKRNIQTLGRSSVSRSRSDHDAFGCLRAPHEFFYRIVVKAKPTPSPEKEDAE